MVPNVLRRVGQIRLNHVGQITFNDQSVRSDFGNRPRSVGLPAV